MMFYGNTTQDTRQLFFDTWQKFKSHAVMSPLEQEIAQVILLHPEYHPVIESPELHRDMSFFPELGEVNPFLHMGLHLAVREQIKTNRPPGISALYEALLAQKGEPMDVEHLIMEQLAGVLWLAQKNNAMPDEQEYLNQIKKAVKAT